MPTRSVQSNNSKKETEETQEINDEEIDVNEVEIDIEKQTIEVKTPEIEDEELDKTWKGPKEFINVVLLFSKGDDELSIEEITEIIDTHRENITDVLVHYLSGGKNENAYPDKNIKQVCRGDAINYVSRPWYVENDEIQELNEQSVLRRMEQVFSISNSKTNYWISDSRFS